MDQYINFYKYIIIIKKNKFNNKKKYIYIFIRKY